MSTLVLRSRSRSGSGRRIARSLSALLIIAGLLALADALATLVWQEPVSAVIALIERGQMNRHWLSYRFAPLTSGEHRILAALDQSRRIAYLAEREQRELRAGDAAGQLTIPRLSARLLFVQGTDPSSLEAGPGHYPWTALPGMGETVAIAGHRTTFLAPFRHLDALRPGDRIVLAMPYARFVYVVQTRRVVSPMAWWVTRNVGYERLVLSACDPVFSAARRLVVFARLSQVAD